MKSIVRILIIPLIILVVYVHLWQRVQVLRIGYKISEADSRKEFLQKENRGFWLSLSRLKAVERIENLSEMGFSEEFKIVELIGAGNFVSYGKEGK